MIVLLWLAVAVAGAATVGATTARSTNSFALPGTGYCVDSRIAAEHGSGGSQPPVVVVLTASAGRQVTEPAAATTAARVFAQVGAAVPHARVVDLASTRDPVFLTHHRRTTWALVHTAVQTGFGGPGAAPPSST